ncbi:MAG TPA: copper amine oxidase N-terminal domain-containing protein [Clostridiaceae bacterium]|nr:copper amine oxidase N-terminal domain-containing protein [Clostridiaceae bacterium]
MKKLALSFILCVLVVFFAASIACAEDNIVEVPNLKIIIDGKLTELRDVPISVNQRTLLPLRELAEKLGVPNDDDHIIWNNKEKSVTIIKDSIKIYLIQGSKTVYVNDTPVELDVAPIGYTNSRTYLPFRFLAETLGKKVIWDGNTESIFVCDAENFDRVKEIMQKSDEAMESVKKFSLSSDVKANIVQSYLKIPMDMDITSGIDLDAKKIHMIMNIDTMGQKQTSEIYYDENYSYVSIPGTGTWVRQDLKEAGLEGVFDNSKILGIDSESYNDMFYSGLRIVETDEDSDIILEGDVYFNNLLDMVSQYMVGMQQSAMKVSDCHLKLYIDRDTYYITGIAAQMKCTVSTAVGDTIVDMDVDIDMTGKYNYSADLVVEIPEEVVKNAVDMTEFTGEVIPEGADE